MKIKFSLLLFILYFIAVNYSSGQIFRNSVMIGGSLSAAYYSGEIKAAGITEKYDITEITATPKIGWFIRQPLAVGLSTEFIYLTVDFDETRDTSSSFLLGGPFVTYYFPNHIFGEASFGYGFNTINDDQQTNLIRIAGGIGYSLFLNEKVAVEPMLRYVYDQRKMPGEVKDTRGGVQLMVGLQVYLYRNPRTMIRNNL